MTMDNQQRLTPVKNCWVKYQDKVGIVTQAVWPNVKVLWIDSRAESIVPISALKSGFQGGQEVLHCPSVSSYPSFGEGIVCRKKELGGRDQILVDFPRIGIQRWIPFESLSWIKGAKHRFITSEKMPDDSSERFRLKVLAHALETWNENTGALSHMEIDPLPHQIHLVHKILAQGHLNWLIADDVGLGKTIETGMLLKALQKRGRARRILLVTPSGLTQQWKEELHSKFGLDDFRIYSNSLISEPREWKFHDHVIGSIDLLKEERHLNSLMQADPWDIIIFDEAHRLSRRQYGMSYEASNRFQLAQKLRSKTQSMLLLSATPHQGKHDKFQSLLHLLHPERAAEIETLQLNPEILQQMMIRNNKADVTDADGNFIFKGKFVRALKAESDVAAKKFDEHLQRYLKNGYEAANTLGNTGKAIGFVMTVYRKLAASSAKAIHTSLLRRKARLQGELLNSLNEEEIHQFDERFLGEAEEIIEIPTKEFFDGELKMLSELIINCELILKNDRKLQVFFENVLTDILKQNPNEKLLIFTEYRSTQEYLHKALSERFGSAKVDIINGSMSHQERRNSIYNFEESGQFLISTEAGGEGINLQRNCHLMVNYDLPWNPMRLVQRIGRLYRYGQKKRVVVFNIYSPETADEQIIELMYQRIDQVVKDLSSIGNEYNDRLSDDILGEVADMMDVESILKEATLEGVSRTSERIEEALQRAKEASTKQRELFEYAAGFNPNETRDEFVPTLEHCRAFIMGMFNLLNIEIIETTHSNELWHIKLPDDLITKLGIRKSRWEVTLSRDLVAKRPDTVMLDLDNFLMKHLLEVAKSYEFMGHTAILETNLLDGSALISGFLRWQDENGNRQRQEYLTWQVLDDGTVVTNPENIGKLLISKIERGEYRKSTNLINQQLFDYVEKAAERRLRQVASRWLHPENIEIVASAWLTS